MFVDHSNSVNLVSPWPKTAERRVFCTGVMNGLMDGRTDGQTDPLIEMRS